MSDAPSGGAAPTEASKPARKRWRGWVAILLIVIASVLAPISVATVWVHNTLLNTDQYVSTVGPLASNADVQNALANRVTNAVVKGADVQQRLKKALPSGAAFAVPFVAQGLQQFVHRVVLKLVQSPRFASLWNGINRRAHTQVVGILTGTGRFSNLKHGDVVLDLGPVVSKATKQLEKLGVTGVSPKNANKKIVLFSSKDLKKVQGGVEFLNHLVVALPIITALAFAGGIAISLRRRTSLLWSGAGLAISMALLLILFNLLRTVYLNSLPASVNSAAAKAVYDQVLSFLRTSLRALFAVGLVVMLGAWLAGPGRVAVRIRTKTQDLVKRAPGQTLVSANVAQWVYRYRIPLRGTAIGLGALILVVWTAPGPWTVLTVALLVALALVVIEILSRGATEPAAAK
jgi:hypothetical protein